MFVNCLVGNLQYFGCGCYLLLNVLEVLSVGGGGGALLGRSCMVFQRMCVLCL